MATHPPTNAGHSNIVSEKKLHLYMDWENIRISSSKGGPGNSELLKRIMTASRKFGRVRVGNSYAASYTEDLTDMLYRHCIEPRLTMAKKENGKVLPNAADIHLAVEAVHDMCKGSHCDGMVLVSGDGGFLPLVQCAKRMGLEVYLISWNFQSTAKNLSEQVDGVAYLESRSRPGKKVEDVS